MQLITVVIDDDMDDIEILVEALEAVDPRLKPITVTDCIMALDWLSRLNGVKPYLIFVDLNLPKLKGERVLEELRKQFNQADTMIVMYSTNMPKEKAAQLMNNGATAAFEKPVKFGKYISILTDILTPR